MFVQLNSVQKYLKNWSHNIFESEKKSITHFSTFEDLYIFSQVDPPLSGFPVYFTTSSQEFPQIFHFLTLTP